MQEDEIIAQFNAKLKYIANEAFLAGDEYTETKKIS